MHLVLEPPDTLGWLRIGMSRTEAGLALDRFKDAAAVSESDRPGLNVFRPSGLMISVSCGAGGTVEAIELGRPYKGGDTVTYQGVDVFALPAREVVNQLSRTVRLVEEDDGASFVAPDLLLSFWRSFVEDDDPAETQGYYFNAVLLARPGYYDGPTG
ncbi:hypothetical protein ABZ570_10100 [Micromonospora sp. NPDC007271]|uniref:hypothetical protein n=1 Tax=Micromonospora sp. NPDC007271 TaxID=3154587 RepID=UPI0033EEFDF3